MLHPDTELRPSDERIGFGVFATRPIPAGTIVWALDRLDQIFPADRVRALGSRYAPIVQRYAYRDGFGAWILCWDLARFVNHSCEANAISTGWHFDIAVRDIEPGEEITNDYACLNLEESFTCLCGSPVCRRQVRPGDFDRLIDGWEAATRAAFTRLFEVKQPLWRWIPNKREVRRAHAQPGRMPSPRRHRFEEPAAAAAARLAQADPIR